MCDGCPRSKENRELGPRIRHVIFGVGKKVAEKIDIDIDVIAIGIGIAIVADTILGNVLVVDMTTAMTSAAAAAVDGLSELNRGIGKRVFVFVLFAFKVFRAFEVNTRWID